MSAAPALSLYRGFNPRSTTIVGPVVAEGACCGPSVPDGALHWFDQLVQPAPGTLALVGEPTNEGVELYLKELRMLRGRPFMVCEDGLMPLSREHMYFGARVAQLVIPGWLPTTLACRPLRRTPKDFTLELAVRFHSEMGDLLRGGTLAS